ncbi:hypothetical protein [Polaribacter aestuariivivens]|uniref:hypothetical protein n=1 Tax=Polaribacter aestuariivivens TaxID=2304626 RepID=UPI00148622F5|nr:hypothetical protein [Polaribacter aestuariivivens]
MIYSLVCFIIGVVVLFFAIKLHSKKDNLWDNSTTLKGILGGIILIILGFITLFKGWN